MKTHVQRQERYRARRETYRKRQEALRNMSPRRQKAYGLLVIFALLVIGVSVFSQPDDGEVKTVEPSREVKSTEVTKTTDEVKAAEPFTTVPKTLGLTVEEFKARWSEEDPQRAAAGHPSLALGEPTSPVRLADGTESIGWEINPSLGLAVGFVGDVRNITGVVLSGSNRFDFMGAMGRAIRTINPEWTPIQTQQLLQDLGWQGRGGSVERGDITYRLVKGDDSSYVFSARSED